MVTTRSSNRGPHRARYSKSGVIPRRRRVRATIPPETVAKIATRVFNRKTETKCVADNVGRNYITIYGSTVVSGTSGQLYSCLPPFAQATGTGAGTTFARVGNRINPTRLTTDLRFVFNQDQLITGPVTAASAGWDITVHIWYGYARRFKSIPEVFNATGPLLGQLLEDGQGTNYPFTGRLNEEPLIIDNEVYSMKHKSFRMYKNAGATNICDAVAPSLSTPMSQVVRHRINWKAPKTLLYGQDSDQYPENYAPIMIVGYCHNDSTLASFNRWTTPTSDPTYIPAIKMYQEDKLYFKDA